ncbi:MAG: hypothetical protein CMD88_02680 [Gammaproteobacteria bacterium]|nr:hypothetical protein [Gammaproteobacteria bacterium]|tara:strand:- start:138 stop:650 length:513 start_codon:yes stop_codon:yes gene_type:complete
MINRERIFQICLILLLYFVIPGTSQAEMKMGIVNLDRLFKEIPIYRDSQSKIKKQFDPRAKKLASLEKEWNSLNDKYLKNEKIMASNEKEKLVKKIQKVEKDFRSKQEKFNKELQKVQGQELSRIRNIVETTIKKYAEKNNFDIIIRADGTTLYAKSYIDITQAIISELQ